MDYSVAIASLLKVEGAEEAIKAIEENTRVLQERAKKSEVLEANVAKVLAENNVEGTDLKAQLETLSTKNKTVLSELEQYKTELENIKNQNAEMQRKINVNKIASKYSANADVVEKLLGNEEISWANETAFISGKAFTDYIDESLAAFKPAIFVQQIEQPKVEAEVETPKLGSGSAKSQTDGDKIVGYLNNMYKMPEHLLRR